MAMVFDPKSKRFVPLSVNYFPHRECNYACEMCFHTEQNSHIESLDEAKRGLRLLAEAGMKKINISGGEPFLKPKFLGEIIKFCKKDLNIESTGIICNGSKVTEKWLDEYGEYLDIMGVSCDSFDDDTNLLIGRSEKGKTVHTRSVFRVAEWCQDRGIMFKLNTVVSKYNWEEDMNDNIEQLAPFRWKVNLLLMLLQNPAHLSFHQVFQVLLLEGENKGPNAIRNAQNMVITDKQFKAFLDRHKSQKCLVPEDNAAMENSYLLLDEKMRYVGLCSCGESLRRLTPVLRFLNCEGGKKIPGRSILEVGVLAAMKEAGWHTETFVERGGIFEWGRKRQDVPAW